MTNIKSYRSYFHIILEKLFLPSV